MKTLPLRLFVYSLLAFPPVVGCLILAIDRNLWGIALIAWGPGIAILEWVRMRHGPGSGISPRHPGSVAAQGPGSAASVQDPAFFAGSHEDPVFRHVVSEASPETTENAALRRNVHHTSVHLPLLASTAHELHKLSKPFSDEIVIIKAQSDAFLTELEKLQHKTKLDEIMRRYQKKIELFQLVRHRFEDNQKVLSDRLTQFSSGIDSIEYTSRKIHDASEQINILSINTSIEAARAGATGVAFKVIAGVINQLAMTTRDLVSEVETAVAGTRQIISESMASITERRAVFLQALSDIQNELTYFYEMLTSYDSDMLNLTQSVRGVINTIGGRIANFSPIYQNQIIAIQCLENLERFIRDLHGSSLPGPDETARADELLIEAIENAERFITTTREAEVLNELLRERGIENLKNIRLNTREIELF